MPLSEEELRLLEQMERALVAEDPKFASTLRGTTRRTAARRRILLGSVILLAGIALLVGGVLSTVPVLGIVGFVVMLGGAALALTAAMNPPRAVTPEVRESGRAGLGVVDGGARQRKRRTASRPSGSFMDRMEERWRRRRDQGY